MPSGSAAGSSGVDLSRAVQLVESTDRALVPHLLKLDKYIDLVIPRGGESLTAYPDYHRIAQDEEGIWRVRDRGIAKRHRLGIGTIVSDAAMQVKYMSGSNIGTIEEGFIARLRKGDCFFFAGRLLEFVRVREMVAYVRKATRNKGTVPTWQGSKMALSTELSDAVLEMMQEAAEGEFLEPELQAARPMLLTQQRLSRIPTPTTLLVSPTRTTRSRRSAASCGPSPATGSSCTPTPAWRSGSSTTSRTASSPSTWRTTSTRSWSPPRRSPRSRTASARWSGAPFSPATSWSGWTSPTSRGPPSGTRPR